MHTLLGTILIILTLFFQSCANTGPRVSKKDVERMEGEFYVNYLDKTDKWTEKIYRVGYQLLKARVPNHSSEIADHNFVGVGVIELHSHLRTYLQVPNHLDGVVVIAPYPGSQSQNLDLQRGDVITALDGIAVKGIKSYYKILKKLESDIVVASILRHGSMFTRVFPVEKVYHQAHFYLSPKSEFQASASFSKISVAMGALKYVRNDDELATILGHELAHVTLKHSPKKIGVNTGSTIFYTGLATAISSVTYSGMGSLVLSPVEKMTTAAISRRYEREADYYGLQHAFHAGYNVEQGSKVFYRLASESKDHGKLSHLFSTHPGDTERYLTLQKIAEELKLSYPYLYKPQIKPYWNQPPPSIGLPKQEAISN